MARTRIVVETTDQKKSALLEAADLQGTSVADWIEEQVIASIPRLAHTQTLGKDDLSDPGQLDDTEAVLESLQGQDWSFTDDDTRYLTHDLHPYPAKFIPQIPSNLIARLSMHGDVICDPFGGSATTAVEAVRMGRRAVSFDANPLSALIGRVKTGFMSADVRADLEQLLASVEGHQISPKATNLKWAQGLTNRYGEFVPDIPNIEKWFTPYAIGELALIRYLIENTTSDVARDAALLALSRIVIRVSNQESETRYVSVKKDIGPTLTLRAYLESLKTVIRRLENATSDLQFADARFLVGDSRTDLTDSLGENSVDLIVTSPPYPNATDYHLYHRFRLFWLGYDPRKLGHIEIGSHLRHQRNDTGFEEYADDMRQAIEGCAKVLQPGRFAVFVVGDALFKGETFSTSDAICEIANHVGLTIIGVIDRPIHQTRRSFAKPARRARAEQLVVLQKPNQPVTIRIHPPAYKMWDYEAILRTREISALTGARVSPSKGDETVEIKASQPALWNLRRLTFSKDFEIAAKTGHPQPTWQKVLENGDSDPGKRKDPKYATHGIHPFKGKFYPQLAKSLLNISGTHVGSRLLDPFCGSGTTLLEGMLNGYAAYGCDFNPLAAKIARAKTGILTAPRDIVDLSMRAMLDRVTNQYEPVPRSFSQFPEDTHTELLNWFPEPVLYKVNWLLSQVRLFGNDLLVDFFEVIISSLIRDVSNQDPKDLRIRRRKEPLDDAPVLELFQEHLEAQQYRLQKYWSVAGRQPGQLFPPSVQQGDTRTKHTFDSLGLDSGSIDCVVTSPPYATALPYIDTDRLSLLAIMGLTSPIRSDLEQRLTGSREIRRGEKSEAESELLEASAYNKIPDTVVDSIRNIYEANSNADVGFRRENMPALLWRYFLDMRANLDQVHRLLRSGGKAFYVVGDSRTKAGEDWVAIETCKHITAIGEMAGLAHSESISIDVTTENFKHIKNAITENKIIVFEKN